MPIFYRIVTYKEYIGGTTKTLTERCDTRTAAADRARVIMLSPATVGLRIMKMYAYPPTKPRRAMNR